MRMATGVTLNLGISSDRKVLGVRSSRCQEVVGVILYVCACACARPPARVRVCVRAPACPRARVSACPRVRVSACPPARLPACPPARPRQYGLVCSESPAEHRFGVVAIDDSGWRGGWRGGPFLCEIGCPLGCSFHGGSRQPSCPLGYSLHGGSRQPSCPVHPTP